MKCELRSTGTLEISAESEVEAYALKIWGREFFECRDFSEAAAKGMTILVRAEPPPKESLPGDVWPARRPA